MTRIIYALPLLVLACLAVLFAISMHKSAEVKIINKPAPEFSAPVFRHEEQSFTQDDLTGKVQLVSFFATWCPACVVEHRQLKKLSEKYDFKLYGIAYKDDEADLKRFLENYGNPFEKIGFDHDGSAYIAWGVTGMPESFIVDQKGNIRYKHIGIITESDIAKKIIPTIQMLQKETE